MTDYPTIDLVLAIHADQITRFGGSPGLRDEGLLQAAIARPQSGYYADLIAEAAAPWESLSQNHPFVDGNKRVAFAATDTFLRMNGLALSVESTAAYLLIIGLYQSNMFNFDTLDRWLRNHVHLRPPEP